MGEAWKRDPEKPKRPMNGFFLFAQEFRKKEPNLKVTEATKKAGDQWKNFTPIQKKPYEDQWEAKMTQYKKDLQKYKDSGKEAQWKKKVGLDAIEKSAAEEKKKKMELEAMRKQKEKMRTQKELALKKKQTDEAKKFGAAEKALAAKVKKIEASRKMKAKLEKQCQK